MHTLRPSRHCASAAAAAAVLQKIATTVKTETAFQTTCSEKLALANAQKNSKTSRQQTVQNNTTTSDTASLKSLHIRISDRVELTDPLDTGDKFVKLRQPGSES